MLKLSSLVCIIGLDGAGMVFAQQADQPVLAINRSIAVQSTTGPMTRSVREEWAGKAISKFLDGDAPRVEPSR